MSDTLRTDLERVLGWTSADERFVARMGEKLDPDRRALLEAVVETRGDTRALAQRVAPDVLERIRARLPERTAATMELLREPLAASWTVPAELSGEQIAQAFFERYAAHLGELTGHVTKAVAAAKAAASGMQALQETQRLVDAISGLDEQLEAVKAAASACAHPNEEPLTERGKELVHQSVESVETLRRLRSLAGEMRARVHEVELALRDWADAPPAQRAATAESMTLHLRAAAATVADMRDELARALTSRIAPDAAS